MRDSVKATAAAGLILYVIFVSSMLVASEFENMVMRKRLGNTKLVLTCQMKDSNQNLIVRGVDQFMVQGDNLVAFFDEGQRVVSRTDTLSCITNQVPGE